MSIVHLTEKEVAARLKLTTRTLRKWRAEGQGIPCMGLGSDEKEIRYRLADVEAYEEGRMMGYKVPLRAAKSMLRAAQTLEIVMRWPMKDDTRALLSSVRNELRDHLHTKKKEA